MADARGASSQRGRKERPPARTADAETLNFKVTTEFKREFKGYAVSQGVTMVELLKEGFELSKRERKQ
jgi:hypothetical protein